MWLYTISWIFIGMNLRNKIKKTINEVAGISFEVREWAQILSSEIDRLTLEADEAESNKQGTPKEVQASPTTYSDNNDEISHFEDMGGGEYYDAIIPSDELMYDAETVKDFPEITSLIRGKIIKVSVEEYGIRVYVDGNFDDVKYGEVLEDMVYEHSQWGQPLYDPNTHNELTAMYFGGTNSIEVEKSYGGRFLDIFSKWKPKPKAKIDKLVINGKDFPETYGKFKVDKWIFNDASRIEYDHYKSGYNKENGDYEVYFNVPIRGLSMGMFVHETKHAYDDWNRMKNGGKPIRDSWEIKNIYTKDFENLILGGAMKFPQLGGVVRMYYLGSKLETPAYLENEYDAPMAQTYRNTGKKLMNFSVDHFFNKKGKPAKGLEDEFVNILINYDIPFFRKFKDVRSFLTHTEKYFNKRGKDIVRRIDKTMYVHGKTQQRPAKGTGNRSNYGTKGTLPF